MKKNRCTYVCLLLAVCLLLSAGCGTDTAADDQGTDLLIYYVKGHPYYGTALGAFIYSHSKYNITLTPFESDEDMCNQLATEIAAGQGPDVVLLSSESAFDIYKAEKSGNIADLSSYFEKDEEFSAEDYYESILDSGMISGGQYLVPFSFSLESIIINQTVLEEAGVDVEAVDDFDAILSLLGAACEAAADDKVGFYMGKYGTGNSTDIQSNFVGRCLENSGVKLISAEGKVSDDIVQMQKVMEFFTVLQEEYEKKQNARGRTWQTDDLPVLCMSVNGSYIYYPLIAEQYTAESMAGDTYVTVPWRNIEGEVQPVVYDYGFVNHNSKSKAAAYDLLRYMMDYDDMPWGPGNPLSVNRNIVGGLLTKSQGAETILSNMTLSKLSQERRGEIEATLDEMATAIVYNTGYYEIAIERLTDCLSTGNQAGLQEELEAELTRYLRE